MVRNTIRLIRASMDPPSINSFRIRLEVCVCIGLSAGEGAERLSREPGGDSCTVMGGDDSGRDQEAEFEIPARTRAAAIFCCWLMSELRTGPGVLVRWMTCWAAAGDCTVGAWRIGVASAGWESRSCDE